MSVKNGEQKVVAVIPARMAASRFYGKPLAMILDLPMIEHVRRRVALCNILEDVYVATCDEKIVEVVAGFGGKAVMTAVTHERCTDRVEEAARTIDADIVVIVQGDEPLFIPEVINSLVEPMRQDSAVVCTNLLSAIHDPNDLNDPNIVKATITHDGDVLYFSRAAIPYPRSPGQSPMYRQTGLAALRKTFLHEFSRLAQTPLEMTESIDLLRILEHGFRIRGVIYDQPTIGVDESADIAKVEAVLKKDSRHRELYQKILRS